MPKHETEQILLNNLGTKHSLVIKFGQFNVTLQSKFFIKKLYEKSSLETSSRLLNFQRILHKKGI